MARIYNKKPLFLSETALFPVKTGENERFFALSAGRIKTDRLGRQPGGTAGRGGHI